MPETRLSASRKISSYQPTQDNLGDFAPLWTLVEQTSTSNEDQGLGDFGNLWQYLENEKEKWGISNPASLMELATVLSNSPHPSRSNSHIKQPPLLPHSSSSEYSSEEEFLLKGHKTSKVTQPVKKKRVRVLVLHPSKGSNKKTSKKKDSMLRAEDKVKIISDVNVKSNPVNVKKVQFDDQPSKDIILKKQTGSLETKPILQKNKKQNTWIPPLLRIPIPITISPDPIHVFVDNSNILAGFLAYCREQQVAQTYASGSKSAAAAIFNPKLDYEALFTILERGRNIDRKVLVASSPLCQPLDAAEDGGYEVSVLRRVKRSQNYETNNSDLPSRLQQRPQIQIEMEKEQCVDELLHLKILESLLDYSAPATLVLASGDGKDAEYFQGGFHKCVVMALNRGWKVEVISWQRQLSHNFLNKKFLEKWKGRYHVVFLDWFAKELGCEF